MNEQVQREDGIRKRLVILAGSSLLIEAIALGLRKSGAFDLLGQLEGTRASLRRVIDARPDVVLVDDLEGSEVALDVVRTIKSADEGIVVLMLMTSTQTPWLQAMFDAGAAAAVSKSTHPAALATVIRETLDGRVIHVESAAYTACARGGQGPEAAGAGLTAREHEVLRLLAAGTTNGEIAQKLWVTEQTVKFHLSNVYRKLNVANRTEASHYAHVNGLVGALSQTAR